MRHSFVGLALLVTMAGALVLASCSTTQTPRSTSEISGAAIKPYGSLKATTMFQLGIDPAVLGSPNTFQAVGAAFLDTLIGVSSEGELIPGLAERWEISPDGKTHTFFIRKGVKFHNGDDLTGEDVKFSIDRVMAPESTAAERAALRADIARVELKDDYTIALHLNRAVYEPLQRGFSEFSGSQAVLPKKYIEEKGIDYWLKNPVGSGPWRVLRHETGTLVELEAVESHWREVPKFKNITLMNVREEATVVAMLKTGELDFASVSPDSVGTLKSAGLRIIPHDGAAGGHLALYYDLNNHQQYAFGDIRVRKALSLAINRQEMVDKLISGYGEPAALWYARPGSYFWDSNLLKASPYDPEQAKRLLVEAGYPDGFSTKIWDSGQGGLNAVHALAVSGYWGKIGVKAELERGTPERSWRLPVMQPRMFNTVMAAAAAGGVLQFEKMEVYHSTRSPHLIRRLPELDRLIELVPATRDPAEKKRIALQAAMMAQNDLSDIATWYVRDLFVAGPKIGEITLTKGFGLFAYNLASITHPK